MDQVYYRHERSEMMRFVPENRRHVLEVGCGAGTFIKSLAGCEEKWGIEPTDAGLEARENLTRLLPGTFDAVKDQLPPKYFDLIICNDVIEHMVDYRRFLEGIRNYIAPGGMLIGSIPNVCFYDVLFRALFENDWQYADDGVLDRTHVAFFTMKSFRRLLEETGYRVVKMQGLWWDERRSNDPRSRFYQVTAKILGKISLGRLSHIRHVQFGFQAEPRVETS